MGILDRQTLITDIVSQVLGQPAENDKTFDWFINKHKPEHFREHFVIMDSLFKQLNGDPAASQLKRTTFLKADAYFGGNCKFMLEFDEFQHFSSARQLTLELYPPALLLNFNSIQWIQFCKQNKLKADKYRHNKQTPDFNFPGGRTVQRAYLDCFRDLLPSIHGLRPTLRISEFEVMDIITGDIEACKKMERLIKSKLTH